MRLALVTACAAPEDDSAENEGGQGLIARGVVTSAESISKQPGLASQTWNDGRAETELSFKLCRQATNKIVGISSETAAFLDAFF